MFWLKRINKIKYKFLSGGIRKEMLQFESYFGAKPCASERRLSYNASLLLPATGWHISIRNQHKVGTWC